MCVCACVWMCGPLGDILLFTPTLPTTATSSRFSLTASFGMMLTAKTERSRGEGGTTRDRRAEEK